MTLESSPRAGVASPTPADSGDRQQALHDLEAQFGMIITRFRQRISANAQRLSPGMQPGEYKVFTTIVRAGTISQATLAETLVADKGQLSRSVRTLEDLGLIERTPDPADGRSRLLTATEDGLRRLAAAREPQEESMMTALSGWSIDDIRTLTNLLHALSTGIAPA